jgi:programmed cell death 6-interacting protein
MPQVFKTLFEVGAWRAACANASAHVKGIVKVFKEVEDHLAEGLRFYMSLQDAVKQHQQQCSDYAYTRALQRDDLQQVCAGGLGYNGWTSQPGQDGGRR